MDDPLLDRFPHTMADLEGPDDIDAKEERLDRIGEEKADLERESE